MSERRADTLLSTMQFIEWFTLQRAWAGLTDDELFWEPVPGSWGVRRRDECRTSTPFGAGDWVTDFDMDVVRAASGGDGFEPMTTIGWLLWHVGSMPERLTDLDFLDGSRTAASGWTSPYLTDHPVFTSGSEAVEAMSKGWAKLRAALGSATDEQLEAPTRWWSYSDGPGRLSSGTEVVASILNEIGHHGTQVCMLRDLYRATRGSGM